MKGIVCLQHPDRETEPHLCVMIGVRPDGPLPGATCACCKECEGICRTKEPKADWPAELRDKTRLLRLYGNSR